MKATAKRLRALCDLVVGVYGPANRAAFSFLKAMEAIALLEQDLMTQAMRDLPGYPSNDLYLEDGRRTAPPLPAGPPVNGAASFLLGSAPDDHWDDDYPGDNTED
jgi:hypothetical protein